MSRSIAVSLSVATAEASLPVASRLYLPEGWAGDVAHRARAGVPEDVVSRTKPRIHPACVQLRRQTRHLHVVRRQLML